MGFYLLIFAHFTGMQTAPQYLYLMKDFQLNALLCMCMHEHFWYTPPNGLSSYFNSKLSPLGFSAIKGWACLSYYDSSTWRKMPFTIHYTSHLHYNTAWRSMANYCLHKRSLAWYRPLSSQLQPPSLHFPNTFFIYIVAFTSYAIKCYTMAR